MASKYRPKGSYKDLLKLSSEEISQLSEAQMRGIVEKLADVANKRIKRLKEAGFDELSPALRMREQSGKSKFKIEKGMKLSELKTEYIKARTFLSPTGTSTRAGIEAYNEKFEDVYQQVLGKPFNDSSNFDKRYKRKKVLKKSVKNKLRDFWDRYDEFMEIMKKKNPDYAKGDTNLDSVANFEEELFNKGKTTTADFEKYARMTYEKREGRINEEGSVSTPITKPRAKTTSKQTKHKGKGKSKEWEVKVSFEKVKIL